MSQTGIAARFFGVRIGRYNLPGLCDAQKDEERPDVCLGSRSLIYQLEEVLRYTRFRHREQMTNLAPDDATPIFSLHFLQNSNLNAFEEANLSEPSGCLQAQAVLLSVSLLSTIGSLTYDKNHERIITSGSVLGAYRAWSVIFLSAAGLAMIVSLW
jgi:hypothetical protein